MFDGVHLKSNGAYWQRWHRTPHGAKVVQSIGPKAKWTEPAALAECKRVELELLRSGQIIDPRDTPTLEAWGCRYKELRTDLHPHTLELYQETIDNLTDYFGQATLISKVSAAEAKLWRSRLTNRHTGGVVTEATRCSHSARAKAIFQEAMDSKLITENPFAKAKTRPPAPGRMAYVATDQVLRILDACPNNGWRALFALCRWTGMRRGEALALTWADIRWEENRLRVQEQKHKRQGKERFPPIEPGRCPSGLTALLLRFRDQAAEGEPLVCAGVRLTTIDRDVLGIISKAGVESYAKPFHALRGSWANDLRKNYPESVANAWVGHTQKVAENHYLSVLEEYYRAPEPQITLATAQVQSGTKSAQNQAQKSIS